MKKRLFIAINFDPATRLAIARLMAQLPDQSGLNKTKVDNLHLTLLFLGDTDEELIPEISRQLDNVAENSNHLSLKFGRIGGFPDTKRPEVIWIGLNGTDLMQLRQNIFERLLPIVPTADTKPFRPHLTIARSQPHFHPELTAALDGRGIGPSSGIGLPPAIVPQIDLMESTLTLGGSIYRKISTYRLQN